MRPGRRHPGRFRFFNSETFSFQRALLLLDERCDGGCGYCFEREKSDCRASLKLAKRLIDTLKLVERRKLSPQLHLFGGEPTLHPGLGEVLGYAARRGVGVTLYTNGGFDKDVLREILRRGSIIRHVQVSIDGPAHVHGKARRMKDGGARFQRVLENFRAMRPAGIEVQAHAVLCRETVGHLEESAVFLKELGPGQCLPVFNIADPLRWTDEDIKTYEVQLEALGERARSELKDAPAGQKPYLYLNQFRQALDHPDGLPAGAYPCLFGAGVTGLCVDPAGDMFYCQLHYFGLKERGQDPRSAKVGDLERGIDWQRLEPLAGATAGMMAGCGGCKGYGCTPRTCMLTNQNAAGDLFSPHPRVCRIYKAGVRVFERFASVRQGQAPVWAH